MNHIRRGDDPKYLALDWLKTFQWLQYQHDEKYHAEISRLSVPQRMAHLVLHLTKYTSDLLYRSMNARLFQADTKRLTDCVIISTSMLNTLNIDMQKLLPVRSFSNNEKWYPGKNLGQFLVSNYQYPEPLGEPVGGSFMAMMILMHRQVGEMAKAVETLDHLEDYPSREKLSKAVVEFWLQAIMVHSFQNKQTIWREVEDRLTEVEMKSMFWERHGIYRLGFQDAPVPMAPDRRLIGGTPAG